MFIIIINKYFEDYENFACDILDTVDAIKEFGDVAVIAKYTHANQIIKELLCLGANIASISLHKEEFEEYYDEYIISVTKDEHEEYEVWCEKFKCENGYLFDDSSVMYVMDDCSSKVIPYCNSEVVYEVAVHDGKEMDECDCEFCDCKYDYHKYDKTTDNDNNFHITIKGDLDLGETISKIEEIETRMARISDFFDETNKFMSLLRL